MPHDNNESKSSPELPFSITPFKEGILLCDNTPSPSPAENLALKFTHSAHQYSIRDSHSEHLSPRFKRAREKLFSFLQKSQIAFANDIDKVAVITNESLKEDEVYWPLNCGLFANIWLVASAKQTTQLGSSYKIPAFREVISGQCLFGSNMLYGVADGISYDLCVPNLVVDKDAVIEEIFVRDTALHPYEHLARATFDHIAPFIKQLVSNDESKLAIHLPVEEYLLNFLDLLLNHHITETTYFRLRAILIERGELHRQYWEQYGQKHQLVIDHESPLRALNLTGFTSLEALLGPELFAEYQQSRAFPEKAYLELIETFLHKMKNASQLEQRFADTWAFVESQKRVTTLKALTKESYTVRIAAASRAYQDCEVLLLHPIQEKPMALSYRRNYSDHFRPIVSLNWIQPLQISNFSKSLFYYIVHQHEYFNYLIKHHIKTMFSQTTMVATGDKEAAAPNNVADDFAAFCLKQETMRSLSSQQVNRRPVGSQALLREERFFKPSNIYCLFKQDYRLSKQYNQAEQEKFDGGENYKLLQKAVSQR
ncbi:MAG: hypothetical protein P4M14_01715 [Gammaproteobacteria bacterium]|nr:hypothetical protein [Gammaproteobacteria bacterium]